MTTDKQFQLTTICQFMRVRTAAFISGAMPIVNIAAFNVGAGGGSIPVAGPGPMWSFSDFYFGSGAPGDILGIENIVAGSQVWIYRLRIVSVYIGAPLDTAIPIFPSLKRTVVTLGGGAVAEPINLRSVFGINPVDVRFPPAAAVAATGQGAAAAVGSVAAVAPIGTDFAMAPSDIQDFITPDAPYELLNGEGLLLSDLIGGTAEYSLSVQLQWGVQ